MLFLAQNSVGLQSVLSGWSEAFNFTAWLLHSIGSLMPFRNKLNVRLSLLISTAVYLKRLSIECHVLYDDVNGA